MLAQLIADLLIMRPSRNPVAALGKTRKTIPYRRGALESWNCRIGTANEDDVDLFILKFSGTAARAERANHHPMDNWNDLRAEIWSVNPPGYGGSDGRASVTKLASSGLAAYNEISKVAAGRPILVIGNSLGTVTSLYLAANHQVDGLILRNPPPLRQLIFGRYGWWNLWLGSSIIAACVPRKICSIRNAANSAAPALFVSSRMDETVPRYYHQKVIRSYAGPKRILRLRNADHTSKIRGGDLQQYLVLLEWLRNRMGLNVQQPNSNMIATS